MPHGCGHMQDAALWYSCRAADCITQQCPTTTSDECSVPHREQPLCCWLQGGCLLARVALCVLCSTATAPEQQQHYKHITGQTSPQTSHALLCRLQNCAAQAVIQIPRCVTLPGTCALRYTRQHVQPALQCSSVVQQQAAGCSSHSLAKKRGGYIKQRATNTARVSETTEPKQGCTKVRSVTESAGLGLTLHANRLLQPQKQLQVGASVQF